jgi:hypothetical protein
MTSFLDDLNRLISDAEDVSEAQSPGGTFEKDLRREICECQQCHLTGTGQLKSQRDKSLNHCANEQKIRYSRIPISLTPFTLVLSLQLNL